MIIHTLKFNNEDINKISSKQIENLKIWSDSDVLILIKEKYRSFEKFYNKLWLNKSRENLAKYLILKEYGGLYINYYLLENKNINNNFILTIINNHNEIMLWKNDLQSKILYKIYSCNDLLLTDNIIYVKQNNNKLINELIKNININIIPENEYQNKIYLGNVFLTKFVTKFYYNLNIDILNTQEELFKNYITIKNKQNKEDIDLYKIKIKNSLYFCKVDYYNTNAYDLCDPDIKIISYEYIYSYSETIIQILSIIIFSYFNYKIILTYIFLLVAIEVIFVYIIIKKVNVKLNKYKIDNKLFFDENKFDFIAKIKKNWKKIAKEAKYILNNAPRLDITRSFDKWNDSEEYFNMIKDKHGWIKAWKYAKDESEVLDNNGMNGNESWLNYGLIINGMNFEPNISSCPLTYKLLNKMRDKINMSGFSYLKGNAVLEEHVDHTGLENNSLAFHIGLIIPKQEDTCKLVIYDNVKDEYFYKIEKEGEVMVFDSNNKHYAYNQSNEDRIIMYIDFKV